MFDFFSLELFKSDAIFMLFGTYSYIYQLLQETVSRPCFTVIWSVAGRILNFLILYIHAFL